MTRVISRRVAEITGADARVGCGEYLQGAPRCRECHDRGMRIFPTDTGSRRDARRRDHVGDAAQLHGRGVGAGGRRMASDRGARRYRLDRRGVVLRPVRVPDYRGPARFPAHGALLPELLREACAAYPALVLHHAARAAGDSAALRGRATLQPRPTGAALASHPQLVTVHTLRLWPLLVAGGRRTVLPGLAADRLAPGATPPPDGLPGDSGRSPAVALRP